VSANIVAIAGSSRRGGNSDQLLDRLVAGAEEAGASVERIAVRSLNMIACTACGMCENTGQCVVQDDMQDVYKLLRACDGIAIATCIYFLGPPARLKALIDRGQALWAEKYLLRKAEPEKSPVKPRLGAIIGVGAMKGEHIFDGLRLTVRAFLTTLDAKIIAEQYYRNMEHAGDIRKVDGALDKACEIGKELAERAAQPIA